MAPPKVAIIGAGPAGITLGRLLHLANIACTIFEGEASASVRTQGGTLDLHTDSGVAAFKQCKLFDDFLKYARYDGEALKLCDKDFRTYISIGGAKSETKLGRPEIDREKLRQILLESLPEGMVKWGHRLRSVEEENGEFVLKFDKSTERGFDLIVGADGAWSKVRPLLTDVVPEYSGVGGIWGNISNAKERYPDLDKLVNRGSLFTFSDKKSIMAQQLGNGSLHVSAAWVRSENWMKERNMDLASQGSIDSVIAETFKDWDERLVKFIQVMDLDEVLQRNLYMLPVGTRWKNRVGITIIGDAAHLMTPYAGEGVNLAMTDSMKLAQAIISASKEEGPEIKDRLTKEVKKFEDDMFTRATKFQALTYTMMSNMLLDPGAPYSTIESYVACAIAHDMPWGVRLFVLGGIHVFYWFYKTFFLRKRSQDKNRAGEVGG